MIEFLPNLSTGRRNHACTPPNPVRNLPILMPPKLELWRTGVS